MDSSCGIIRTQWNFPNCTGAMDGKQFLIKQPKIAAPNSVTTKDRLVLLCWLSRILITRLSTSMLEVLVELTMAEFLKIVLLQEL